ncbi:MAG: thioredoxin domain-containing protein [bacterium]|nr:thioredoxin domain-containing protein [bacterium]
MSQEVKIIFGIIVVTVLLLVGGIFLVNRNSSNQTNENVLATTEMSRLVREDSIIIATKSATTTIVEFADFQCPACAAAQPLLDELLTTYQGKVNYVYRHLPLPQHKHAMLAAESSEAAKVQGKFLEMQQLLYSRQTQWASAEDAKVLFVEYAKELRLDTESFTKAIDEKQAEGKILRDVSDAQALKVSATPTFYINGQMIQGVPDKTEFQRIIEGTK